MQTAINYVMDRQTFRKFANDRNWKFAATMPTNPHFYTVRGGTDRHLFESAAGYIRDRGARMFIRGSWTTCLNIDGCRYWFGGNLQNVAVIKRAELSNVLPYDEIADRFDRIHADGDLYEETVDIMRMIGRLEGSVLDVGAGTGRFLDFKVVDSYTGIEPSMKMIEAFQAKHRARVIGCRFEDLPNYRQFDNVVAIGSGSYIEDLSLFRKFWNGKGQLFATFIPEDREPPYFEAMANRPKYIRRPATSLVKEFQTAAIQYGGQLIVQKKGNGIV